MKKNSFIAGFLAILMSVTVQLHGQVAISEDNASPDNSAMLDVRSTTKGVLVPRMTQAQRNLISGPATGLMIFQTDNTPGYYFNSGTGNTPLWVRFGELTLPYSGSTLSANPVFQVTNTGTGSGLDGISICQYYGIGVHGTGTNPNGNATGVMGETNGISGKGVFGKSNNVSGTNYGVYGQSCSTSGTGVYGLATSLSGLTMGVYGETLSPDGGRGVEGYASVSTGTAIGVMGSSTSSAGIGVSGKEWSTTGINYGVRGESASNSGAGVFGIATNLVGSTFGVYGEASSTDGYGVTGIATATSGPTGGVYGETHSPDGGSGVMGFADVTSGNSAGVWGDSQAPNGYGVSGKAWNSTGNNIGVQGLSLSSAGKGVYGYASNPGGNTYGVYGRTASPDGKAVYGYASSVQGTPCGVYGESASSGGFSGYFTGGKFYVNGNAGIGTTSPDCQLVVQAPDNLSRNMLLIKNGSGSNRIQMRQNSNGSGGVWVYNGSDENTIFLYGDGSSYINSGNLGIGTSSPSQLLDVAGNGRFRAVGSGAYANQLNLASDGTLTTASSDVRLKENINTLQNSLEKVMQLRGVTFTWKTDPGMGNRIGFIAQEFEKVFPELVFTNKTDGYKGINYAEVSAVLVEAVKELKAQNDRLKMENEQMNARLEKIEALLGPRAEK